MILVLLCSAPKLNPHHQEKNPLLRSCNTARGIHDTPAVSFKIPAPDLVESGTKGYLSESNPRGPFFKVEVEFHHRKVEWVKAC
ncbi:hypothetical protein VNO80_20744 [Phaseolus coccineus]|uniref:Uncharacterized protein n=1 Tax=Phaseolus coccineus TaxID=3886 RepID=A0AAN9M1X2_PHACN